MLFGRAGPILVHLQGLEGEWREDDDEDYEDYEYDTFDFDVPPTTISLKPKVDQSVCSICIGDMDAEGKMKLKCGHEFCDECLSSYLVHQLRCREVMNGQESRLEPRFSSSLSFSYAHLTVRQFWGVRCPSYGCQCVLDENLIENLIDDQAKQIFKSTVRDLIDRERVRQLSIISHVELGRWAKKFNAKCCPKCFSPIEKHLGCDHMHCFACKHHFLWSQAPLFGTSKHWWRADKIPE